MPDRVIIEPVAPPVDAVQAMFDLLRAAERPLIIAGTQVYWDGASDALRELTDQTAIPVFTNGAGRGTLSMDHPHCFKAARGKACLLYTSDAADERSSVDLGGRRIIKKKKRVNNTTLRRRNRQCNNRDSRNTQ